MLPGKLFSETQKSSLSISPDKSFLSIPNRWCRNPSASHRTMDHAISRVQSVPFHGPRSHDGCSACRIQSASGFYHKPGGCRLEPAFILCSLNFPSSPCCLGPISICVTQHVVIGKPSGESFSEQYFSSSCCVYPVPSHALLSPGHSSSTTSQNWPP